MCPRCKNCDIKETDNYCKICGLQLTEKSLGGKRNEQ